jgi:hypothetical protein
VNQRALIDKILARYSGKFTVFRELVQNADDAGATTVQILFHTDHSAERVLGAENTGERTNHAFPQLKDIVLTKWTIKNNGEIFREIDWNRLKKIGASLQSKRSYFPCFSPISITDCLILDL